MKNFLTDEKRKELRAAHRKERDRRVADRIKAVILKDQGWPCNKIAVALMLDQETINEHIKSYLKNQKLKPENGGSECKLKNEQLTELIKHLDEFTYTKTKDICIYIKKKYSVSYTVGGLTNLLHRVGFTYKKPKETPGKADSEKQKAFIEEYEKLKTTATENEPILFIDSVHPTMATKLSYGWIRKGENKLIASTASRTRVNLSGAIQLKDLTTITQSFDTINAENTIAFLGKIKDKFPHASKIHIILDQSGYHRSQAVRAFTEQNGIDLHFLPPYSPNLNPIERLWKIMNEYVRNNQHFATPEQFRKSIKFFFENTLPEISFSLLSRINDNFSVVKHGPILKSGSSC